MEAQIETEATDQAAPPEPETAASENPEAGGRPRRGIAWRNILRCLMLTGVLAAVTTIAWRPGVMRVSLLMTMANPSRGESLNWKPEETPAPALPPRKSVRSPAEWRLGPAYQASWTGSRPSAQKPGVHGETLSRLRWNRYSANPWHWQDDVAPPRRRTASVGEPAQKPASAFRVGNLATWPQATPPAPRSLAAPGLPGLDQVPPTQSTALPASPGVVAPSLPPLSGELPPLPTLELPRPVESSAAATVQAAPARRPAESPTNVGPPVATAATPASASPNGRSSTLRPPSETPGTTPAPAETDWKNREITGPIPGAYLTIYPKLKFIGLCVPGQGYIRKYHQVVGPVDPAGGKTHAQDGKTPYGKYYIAGRERDDEGPHLYLSWPAPEDARRLGLDPARILEVDAAWQRKTMPPQETAAGGGIGFDSLGGVVDVTDGGFSLESPYLEELYLALPDGAWVFIQE